MSSLGISPDLADAWLNSLRNVPFTAGITCAQLHTGAPGSAGTANRSAVTTRSQAFFASPDGHTITLLSGVGVSPTFDMLTDETITHISVWSGFESDESALFLWPAVLNTPAIVAEGDVFNLNACTLTFLGLAS